MDELVESPLIRPEFQPTAFIRGYILSPLPRLKNSTTAEKQAFTAEKSSG